VRPAVEAQSKPALTWEQIRERFETSNPTLLADKVTIDESKAEEITAFLRPNPNFTLTADGTQIAPHKGVWQPFVGTFESPGVSYLHERQHKRELRLESAKKGTLITESSHADLERTLLFTLRGAFVSTLQAKAVVQLATDDLSYYDHVLDVSRDRFKAGDIAQIDLDRLELQRVQYESDLQTAEVNLRTAKIQLLTLLNDRSPVEQFDVTGVFDFVEQLASRDEFRKIALDTRPDLRAAVQAVDKAQTDHKLAVANGSTDPTFGTWYTHNASTNNPVAINTLGVSVGIPLRVFDRNQGEKLRTQLDVTRNERLRELAESQVLSDVDSGYATLDSTLKLLLPYKAKYLQQSVRVRDTVYFSYQHGGASLLDFLNAESEYRSVQLSYVNLVSSYLTAAAQMNMAVGREVIQ
jgi:outer membrane protein, heavy metal efflux system